MLANRELAKLTQANFQLSELTIQAAAITRGNPNDFKSCVNRTIHRLRQGNKEDQSFDSLPLCSLCNSAAWPKQQAPSYWRQITAFPGRRVGSSCNSNWSKFGRLDPNCHETCVLFTLGFFFTGFLPFKTRIELQIQKQQKSIWMLRSVKK